MPFDGIVSQGSAPLSDLTEVRRLEVIESALELNILSAQAALDTAGNAAKKFPVQSETHRKANDMLVMHAPKLPNVRNRLCAFWYAASTATPDTECEQKAMEGLVKTAPLEPSQDVRRTALAYVADNTPITNPVNGEAREELARLRPCFSNNPCEDRRTIWKMEL